MFFFFLLRELLAADGGNKNGVGGKLASVGGYIAGAPGKRKQRHAHNGFPAVSGINPQARVHVARYKKGNRLTTNRLPYLVYEPSLPNELAYCPL